jgi:hypothetical protein
MTTKILGISDPVFPIPTLPNGDLALLSPRRVSLTR